MTPQRRFGATFGLLLFAAGLGFIHLPFLDVEQIGRIAGTASQRFETRLAFSLGSLGVTPFLSAALLVEIVLLVRPRLRPLRGGTPAMRAPIERWIMGLTFVVAAVQAYFVYQQLLAIDWQLGVIPEGLGRERIGSVAIIGSLVAGVALLLIAARLIERVGLGNGIAVVSLAGLVAVAPSLLDTLVRAWSSETISAFGVLVFAGSIAGVVVATRWIVGDLLPHPAYATGGIAPRRPMAGVVPLVLATGVLQIAGMIAGLVQRAPRHAAAAVEISRTHELLFTVAFGVALAFWFHRRNGYDRELKKRALGESLVWLVALVAITNVHAKLALGITIPVLLIVHATAVWLDMRAEARVRAEVPELIPFWRWADVATLDAALRELRAASIFVFPRGAYVRSLYYGFAPHFAIDLLVPPKDVERATQLLQNKNA